MPGVQTIAFNLPNDERVREAKGAKKVILANVLGAKYDRILAPMAGLVLVPDQARLVTKKYMTNETLFHELSHSLGPGTINVGGRQTTVNAELKDQYSAIEEAKADVMGVYNILYLMQPRRASDRRARAAARHLFRRHLPRGPLRHRRGARARRGDAIFLSEGERRVRLGRRRAALPDRL